MLDAGRYYIDGYSLIKTPGLEKISRALHELFACDVAPEGFSWQQKYQNTLDLRPLALRYEPAFLTELDELGVFRKMDSLIGSDLVLTHVQVRKSGQGPSYMDWHRDSYEYGRLSVGNFPPAHKLIFYPSFGDAPAPKLKLAEGSHRRCGRSFAEDMLVVDASKVVNYESSADTILLFDTSIMHAVIPEAAPDGSIRIIYSFLRSVQFEQTLRGQPLHDEQCDEYKRIRGWL